MAKPEFHDEASLIDATVKLGNKALQIGAIHTFVVRYFADNSQFYISDENQSEEALTPEEAYMQFKKLLAKSEK